MMADCIFCGIASKKIPSRIVAEKDGLLAFQDTNPQAPTHVLIVPKRHIATLNDLSSGDAELLGRAILFGAELAKSLGFNHSGYRLVFNTGAGAGQSVLHIHLHLLGGRDFSWPPG
jgi:histidine triad (HIT) family protein